MSNQSTLEKLLTETIVSQVMESIKNKGDIVTKVDVESLIKSSDELILSAVNKAIETGNVKINSNLASFRQEIADRIAKGVDTRHQTKILEIRDYRLLDNDGNPQVVNVGRQHKQFEHFLFLLKSRLPVYIFGPTGSGKTMATKILAEQVLKLPLYRKVMSSQTSESHLLGYANSSGNYVEGIFYKPFVNGGLLLVDELDNGNANVNTVVKMLNDTDLCYFPVIGNCKKHKDFYLVANANTVGTGATRQYVGRAPQDKAMLNTFAYLDWDYDTELEKELGWQEYQQSGGKNEKEFDQILENLWRLRKAAEELKLDFIFSTRNLIYAMRLHAQCENPTKEQLNLIVKSTIMRDCTKEQFAKIYEKANTMRAVVRYGEAGVIDAELVGDVKKDEPPF